MFRGAAIPGRRELFEAVLSEEGIPYVVRSEGGIAEHPLTVGPMGQFIIFVPREEAAHAADLLSQVDAAPSADEAIDDQREEPLGLLSRIRRDPSPKDKRAYLWMGVVSAAAGVLLLMQWPSPAVIFGVLLLAVVAPLMIAASR